MLLLWQAQQLLQNTFSIFNFLNDKIDRYKFIDAVQSITNYFVVPDVNCIPPMKDNIEIGN